MADIRALRAFVNRHMTSTNGWRRRRHNIKQKSLWMISTRCRFAATVAMGGSSLNMSMGREDMGGMIIRMGYSHELVPNKLSFFNPRLPHMIQPNKISAVAGSSFPMTFDAGKHPPPSFPQNQAPNPIPPKNSRPPNHIRPLSNPKPLPSQRRLTHRLPPRSYRLGNRSTHPLLPKKRPNPKRNSLMLQPAPITPDLLERRDRRRIRGRRRREEVHAPETHCRGRLRAARVRGMATVVVVVGIP